MELTLLTAVFIVEGDVESTKEEQTTAWQWLIDTGHAWRLQGWYGRTAMALIEAGVCIMKVSNE